MTSEEKIRDLLAKWEEARENGVEISPEDLTDHQDEREELRTRIAGIKSFQKFKQPFIPSGGTVNYPNIPGFEILKELGRGGMGVVYQAEQQVNKSRRLVAIKMIRGQYAADPEYLRRFRFEAEALVRLEHPNIVRVYEAGDDEGQPYFAMQYVDGKTIENHGTGDCDLNREAQRQIASLFVKVASAIDFAHQRGIIHRDVKPGNILVATDGTPFVTDFGLAISLQAESIQTPAGLILGTPSYMAPEVASGQEKGTIKSDVYGIGAVLYEILTGRPPYRGTDLLQTLLMITEGKLARPRSINPHIDPDLETICLKALREKETRYNSANELAEDLQLWLDGKPIGAREFSIPERVWRFCKRNPAFVGLSAALAVTVLTAVLLVGWQFHQAEISSIKADAASKLKEQVILENKRLALASNLFHFATGWMSDDESQAKFSAINEMSAVLGMRNSKSVKLKAKEGVLKTLDDIKDLLAEHPQDTHSRLLLALGYQSMADLLLRESNINTGMIPSEQIWSILQNRPISEPVKTAYLHSMKYVDMTHELLRELDPDLDPPEFPSYRNDIRALLSANEEQRAMLLGLLHHFTESLKAVDDALKWNLNDDDSRLRLEAFRERQLRSAEYEQSQPRPKPCDFAKETSLAAYLAQSKGVTDPAIYNAACIFALGAGDTDATPEVREQRAVQSVRYLVEIADRNYFRSKNKQNELSKDKDLASLRDRDDFKDLMKKVTQK